MSDTFDITKQPMAGGNVNSPASGTYGEKEAQRRLEESFPKANPAQSPAVLGSPMPAPTPTGTAPAPAGLPPALLRPTGRPDVPQATPLGAAPVNPVQAAATARQRTMAQLDALLADPNISSVTRQWAEELVSGLIKGSTR